MRAYTSKPPATADTSDFIFYDIESLKNAFTLAAYNPQEQRLAIFYLVDDLHTFDPIDENELKSRIMLRNPAYAALDGASADNIFLYDLRYQINNEILANTFGASTADPVNDPDSPDIFGNVFRPVCDTDPIYDHTKHPFFAGYNSLNYDTTMLALYLDMALSYRKTPGLAAGRPQDGANTPANPTQAQMFTIPSAAALRAENDMLFSDEHRARMPGYLRSKEKGGWDSTSNLLRRNMLSSGRYIDVAQLNEKQKYVGLKRLCAMEGLQVLESDKLSGPNAHLSSTDDLYELLAYNVSDVVNLDKLFRHKLYAQAFDVKASLLRRYPETVFDARWGTHTPDTGNVKKIRNFRLRVDSTSAQFVTCVLAPYAPLKDIDGVSFMYPHPEVAREHDIEPFDVLEEAKRFFYEKVTDESAREKFDQVYAYYSEFRGLDFNVIRWKAAHEEGVRNRNQIYEKVGYVPKRHTNLLYARTDGTYSSGFATFSTGGIHGAEYNKPLYEFDVFNEQQSKSALRTLISDCEKQFPATETMNSATHLRTMAGRQQAIGYNNELLFAANGTPILEKDLPLLDDNGNVVMKKNKKGEDVVAKRGTTHVRLDITDKRPVPIWVAHKDILATGSTIKNGCEYKDLNETSIRIFTHTAKNTNPINKRYVFTSVAKAIHEDFSSYYPSLLTNMRAFYNPELGEDRYLALYNEKEELGRRIKESNDPAERQALTVSRNAIKLLLNAASGAGDAGHANNILMNNQVISMRLIGQLFSWMVGQAQTFEGARIVSTNTDGLYSTDLSAEKNNAILEELGKRIMVLIEPEELMLVSKDSNNRLEMMSHDTDRAKTGDVIGASGGTLACYSGPSPDRSLSHPAAIDAAMVEYLKRIAFGTDPRIGINREFNSQVGMEILNEIRGDHTNARHAAIMFQNVISASVGKYTFPFRSDPLDEEKVKTLVELTKKNRKSGGDVVMSIKDKKAEIEKLFTNARPMQHVNRVFAMLPGTPDTCSLNAVGSWKVSDAAKANRAASNESGQVTYVTTPLAHKLMRELGYGFNNRDASQGYHLISEMDTDVRRISGIAPNWHMKIYNHDLHVAPEEEIIDIMANLDMNVYLSMFRNTFNKSWRNMTADDVKSKIPEMLGASDILLSDSEESVWIDE